MAAPPNGPLSIRSAAPNPTAPIGRKAVSRKVVGPTSGDQPSLQYIPQTTQPTELQTRHVSQPLVAPYPVQAGSFQARQFSQPNPAPIHRADVNSALPVYTVPPAQHSLPSSGRSSTVPAELPSSQPIVQYGNSDRRQSSVSIVQNHVPQKPVQYPSPQQAPPAAVSVSGSPQLGLHVQTTPQAPIPGQVQRSISSDSTRTFASRASIVSSTGPSTSSSSIAPHMSQPISPAVSIAQSTNTNVGTNAPPPQVILTCNRCNGGILLNTPVYECLVCSTANIPTSFCFSCFNNGAAFSTHPHNKAYFITAADPPVQVPQLSIPMHLWAAHRNSAGFIYYRHRSLNVKTHLKPIAPQGPTLQDGWQQFADPDGRKYYFNTKTGKSSWTPPVIALPHGWVEIKTPDGIPFYVCELLQLSTWDIPGETPTPRAKTGTVIMSNTKTKGVVTTKGLVATTDTAVNVAKLSAAADLTGVGIVTATKAAAKLTGIGMKYATKKMKMEKLPNPESMKKANVYLNQAERVAKVVNGMDLGDNIFDGGSDNGDYEATASVNDDASLQYNGLYEESSFGGTEPQEECMDTPQQDPTATQQLVYDPQSVSNGQSMVLEQQTVPQETTNASITATAVPAQYIQENSQLTTSGEDVALAQPEFQQQDPSLVSQTDYETLQLTEEINSVTVTSNTCVQDSSYATVYGEPPPLGSSAYSYEFQASSNSLAVGDPPVQLPGQSTEQANTINEADIVTIQEASSNMISEPSGTTEPCTQEQQEQQLFQQSYNETILQTSSSVSTSGNGGQESVSQPVSASLQPAEESQKLFESLLQQSVQEPTPQMLYEPQQSSPQIMQESIEQAQPRPETDQESPQNNMQQPPLQNSEKLSYPRPQNTPVSLQQHNIHPHQMPSPLLNHRISNQHVSHQVPQQFIPSVSHQPHASVSTPPVVLPTNAYSPVYGTQPWMPNPSITELPTTESSMTNLHTNASMSTSSTGHSSSSFKS